MPDRIIESIPKQPGSYILWLHISRSQGLTVGKLGWFNFPAGEYFYMGSARGPGGLRARLGRHLRGNGQPHWHIDRLRAAAQVRGFGYQVNDAHFRNLRSTQCVPRECDWSQKLAVLPKAIFPVPGFGASDCRSGCSAHLVHFPMGIPHMPERIANQTGIDLLTL